MPSIIALTASLAVARASRLPMDSAPMPLAPLVLATALVCFLAFSMPAKTFTFKLSLLSFSQFFDAS